MRKMSTTDCAIYYNNTVNTVELPFFNSQASSIMDLLAQGFEEPGLEDLAGWPTATDPLSDVDEVFVGGHEQDRSFNSDREASWTCQNDWKALCSQLVSMSEDAVSDVDLLALVLSYSQSTADPRKLATQLISRFESFGNVVSARCTQINGAAKIHPDMIDFLRLIRAAGTRLAREEISNRPVLDAWDKLMTYLRSAMAHQPVEQFRILFLDRRNVLIADEVQHRGTIDHTPVYPREVARRALELDASAIIMAHNHPSNHPAPSKADIEMTKLVRETVERLGIVLHDHVIVSRRGHSSFRSLGLLHDKAR